MKYYAVRIGRKPGIYTTWAEAESQVKGYKGAIYKSFTNTNAANQFLNQNDLKPKKGAEIETKIEIKNNIKSKTIKKDKPQMANNKMITSIYTDGSSQEQKYGGYGIVIVTTSLRNSIIEI